MFIHSLWIFMSLGVWNKMTRLLSDNKFNGILYQMKCIYLCDETFDKAGNLNTCLTVVGIILFGYCSRSSSVVHI